MQYDFNRLNSYDFEKLCQALAKTFLGPACTTFGEGVDGGREASFTGRAPFPSQVESWDGYWVIQAKFRTITSAAQSSDHKWLKKQMEAELEKYLTRENKVTIPDNLIFMTNIILTPAANSGGQDKISALCRALEKQYHINHIHVISSDDLQRLLDLNRDIATAYAPFILPGDILAELLKMLHTEKDRQGIIHEGICRFLEAEFFEDSQSKLEQAGRLTSEKVNLEKVFIDLDVKAEKSRDDNFRFVDHVIGLGNQILRWNELSVDNRFVLKAGPGQGKSTLSQFLAQTYRAFFLREHDPYSATFDAIGHFINDYNSLIKTTPSWNRIPIKIILKDYAGWIQDVKAENNHVTTSLTQYIVTLIAKKADITIEASELEMVICSMPSLIIFDGLDEVPVSSNREEVVQELHKFTEMVLRRMNADSIIVATTRPQGYSKEFDGSKYLHVNILDLDAQNCNTYLERLLLNIIDNISERENKLRILNKALSDPQVSRIMKSPLQASIMAILVKIGGEPPTNKFDLFKQYFETIFNREKQREIAQILSSDKKWIVDIHYKLGLYLQAISEKEYNPSASIPRSRFESLVYEYLLDNGVEEDEICRINAEIQTAAIDRLVFISHLEDEKVGFAIRSLQEYFAANGYIHNTSDSIVSERIRKIAGSAYWSNTLLFVIGYLADSKSYLTDFVLSICAELNGEGNDPTELNLNAIAKQGSWLALDILNEGIYRQQRKLENRFCSYLQPLLQLPYLAKHIELANLSQKIVDNWLADYIRVELMNNPMNMTCWRTLNLLCLTGKCQYQDAIALFPSNPKDEIVVLDVFMGRFKISNVIVEHLAVRFPLYSSEDLHFLFEKRTNDFLVQLFEVLDEEKKTRAWGIIFWVFAAGFASSQMFIGLLKKLGMEKDKLPSRTTRLFSSDLRSHTLAISGGFWCFVELFEPVNDGIIDSLLRISKNLKHDLIVTFLEYLRDQTFEKYSIFIELVNKEEIFMRDLIKESISNLDSLTYYLQKGTEKTQTDFDIAKIEVEFFLESSTPLTTKDPILIRKYANRYDMVIGEPLGEVLSFINVFADNHSQEVNELFVILMNWISFDLTLADYIRLKKDSDFIKLFQNKLNSIDIHSENDKTYLFPMFFLAYSIQEIADLMSRDLLMVNGRLKEFELSNNFIVDRALMSEVFRNCCKAIHLQLLNGAKASYKYLIQIILFNSFATGEVHYGYIPYQQIIEDRHLDIFGALLLVLDPSLSQDKLDIIESKLKTNLETEESDFLIAVIHLLKYVQHTSQKDKLLILLHQNLAHIKGGEAALMEAIREHAQNQASKVELLNNFEVN